MIRFNEDPHKGGYAYFPTRAVTAFFPPGEDIQPMLKELSATGFPDDVIEVFAGTAGLKRLDPEGLRHGWWVRFMLELEGLFSDEFEDLVKAEKILRAGGSVVAVFTFKDDDKKKRVIEILKSHHGQDVMYWGPLVIEHFSL